jgi:hypothetical protein
LENNSKCPTINFSEGERAMIVKDYFGDWGIIIGKWAEFRKGVPGKPGRDLFF